MSRWIDKHKYLLESGRSNIALVCVNLCASVRKVHDGFTTYPAPVPLKNIHCHLLGIKTQIPKSTHEP